jgi:hypothetical protein
MHQHEQMHTNFFIHCLLSACLSDFVFGDFFGLLDHLAEKLVLVGNESLLENNRQLGLGYHRFNHKIVGLQFPYFRGLFVVLFHFDDPWQDGEVACNCNFPGDKTTPLRKQLLLVVSLEVLGVKPGCGPDDLEDFVMQKHNAATQ